MARKVIIRFKNEDIHDPQPWPVVLDEVNDVTSGLGNDDGSRLIGFGPRGEYRITVLPEDAWDAPEKVIGLSPSFSDGHGFFAWDLPVSHIEITDTEEVGS